MMGKKRKRWLWRILIGGAVVLALGAGLTVYLLQRPPQVWSQAQQILEETTPQERAQIASNVMDRINHASLVLDEKQADQLAGDADPAADDPLTGELTHDPDAQPGDARFAVATSKPKVDQTFELRLNNTELVSVVADVFDDWTSQRGYVLPDEMTQPVIMVDDGKMVMAFEIDTPSWRQVFSGEVALRFRSDGMAEGSVTQLTAGSLPMSLNSFAQTLSKHLPEDQAHRIGDWVSQLESFKFRPVFELEDRRRARVTQVSVGREVLTLQMRVQDAATYKRHNGLMKSGIAKVTDERLPALDPALERDGPAIADVPTLTD